MDPANSLRAISIRVISQMTQDRVKPTTYSKALVALQAALNENSQMKTLLSAAKAHGAPEIKAALSKAAPKAPVLTDAPNHEALELAPAPANVEEFNTTYQFLFGIEPRAAGQYFNYWFAKI